MKKVLMPLAPGFEAIEAATVLGILGRVRIDVTVAGRTAGPIAGTDKVQIVADATLDEVNPADFDMLVILGGDGANLLKDDARVRQIVMAMAAKGAYLAAICRGPIVLAAAGVLAGKRVTSSPSTRSALDGTTWVEDRVVVDDFSGHVLNCHCETLPARRMCGLQESVRNPAPISPTKNRNSREKLRIDGRRRQSPT
jgi:4-methyl-5(b-hydroxyethyl)-thiazole monophosphate biosynthesis